MARHLLTVDGVRKGRSRGQPFQSSFQPTDRRGQPVALRNSLQVSPTPAGGSDDASFRHNVSAAHPSPPPPPPPPAPGPPPALPPPPPPPPPPHYPPTPPHPLH